ncbi:MAG: hypothetical protein K1X71_20060 [Pirellulales bacterium]|nr:hypothetical protein [Pirellulales bacterium]
MARVFDIDAANLENVLRGARNLIDDLRDRTTRIENPAPLSRIRRSRESLSGGSTFELVAELERIGFNDQSGVVLLACNNAASVADFAAKSTNCRILFTARSMRRLESLYEIWTLLEQLRADADSETNAQSLRGYVTEFELAAERLRKSLDWNPSSLSTISFAVLHANGRAREQVQEILRAIMRVSFPGKESVRFGRAHVDAWPEDKRESQVRGITTINVYDSPPTVASETVVTDAAQAKIEARPEGDGETDQRPEALVGYLGGAALADALGVHLTQRCAFDRALGRQRRNLWDCCREVSNPEVNSPKYLYRADSPKLLDIAAKYRTAKSV